MNISRVARAPLQAFLRIMPPPVGADTSASNYIQLINENEVLMVPPAVSVRRAELTLSAEELISSL